MKTNSPQVLLLNDDDKLIYLLKGHDASLRNAVLHWCQIVINYLENNLSGVVRGVPFESGFF